MAEVVKNPDSDELFVVDEFGNQNYEKNLLGDEFYPKESIYAKRNDGSQFYAKRRSGDEYYPQFLGLAKSSTGKELYARSNDLTEIYPRNESGEQFFALDENGMQYPARDPNGNEIPISAFYPVKFNGVPRYYVDASGESVYPRDELNNEVYELWYDETDRKTVFGHDRYGNDKYAKDAKGAERYPETGQMAFSSEGNISYAKDADGSEYYPVHMFLDKYAVRADGSEIYPIREGIETVIGNKYAKDEKGNYVYPKDKNGEYISLDIGMIGRYPMDVEGTIMLPERNGRAEFIAGSGVTENDVLTAMDRNPHGNYYLTHLKYKDGRLVSKLKGNWSDLQFYILIVIVSVMLIISFFLIFLNFST